MWAYPHQFFGELTIPFEEYLRNWKLEKLRGELSSDFNSRLCISNMKLLSRLSSFFCSKMPRYVQQVRNRQLVTIYSVPTHTLSHVDKTVRYPLIISNNVSIQVE